jgi:N-acetylmuramic acid 6-phosphate (MurNAc-6-P) etherase
MASDVPALGGRQGLIFSNAPKGISTITLELIPITENITMEQLGQLVKNTIVDVSNPEDVLTADQLQISMNVTKTKKESSKLRMRG